MICYLHGKHDVIFMENKFDIEKSDCTQENFEFFTGSIGTQRTTMLNITTTHQKMAMLKIGKLLSTKKLKDLNEQGDHLTN